jgi:hypothetical protein
VNGARHDGTCAEIVFPRSCPAAGGEVALEDYARALTGASLATALPGGEPGHVRGVHLCSLPGPLGEGVREDVFAFARDLAGRPGGGLGWS